MKKDFSLEQDIKQRTITAKNVKAINARLRPGNLFSIDGFIEGLPVLPGSNIEYKTWISKTLHGGKDGLETTENRYVPYRLSSGNHFHEKFQSYGSTYTPWDIYTVNIQFRDEFGNESNVQSVEVSVDEDVMFLEDPRANLYMGIMAHQTVTGPAARYNYEYYYNGFEVSFNLKAGIGVKITKIEYFIEVYTNTTDKRIFSHTVNAGNENANGVDKFILHPENYKYLWARNGVRDSYYTQTGARSSRNLDLANNNGWEELYRDRLLLMRIYTDNGKKYEKKGRAYEDRKDGWIGIKAHKV